MNYYYSAFGLTIKSGFKCPELMMIKENSAPDVTITNGKVPKDLDEPRKGVRVQVNENQTLFCVDNVARFLIQNGNEIIIEPEHPTCKDSIRLFLLGNAFAALLYQRKTLALHAGSMVIGETCIAFSGESGTGKSALLDAFARKGNRVVNDELCAVTFSDDGDPLAHPGTTVIMLWQDILESCSVDTGLLRSVRPGINKYILPLNDRRQEDKIPLSALYIMERGKNEPPAIVELMGKEKFAAIQNAVFNREVLQTRAGECELFKHSSHLANKVPVYHITYPGGEFTPDRLAVFLEENGVVHG